jgi:formamidopyrimidine-DNA glycosylase
MPEALEVELARRATDDLLGRTMVAVERTDPLVVGDGVDVAVPGATIEAVTRRGKLLVVHTDGPTLGIHFGMTGRLLREGDPVIGRLADDQRLVYGPGADLPVWDRWAVRLDDGSQLRLQDPRRLGRVWLEPDVERLGPDVLTLRRADLAAALARRRAPLKAVLLDQTSVAGLGNMLVDEVLWWSSLDPHRPAASLAPDEVAALQHAIRRRLPVMLRRGGSHTGTLSPSLRAPGGHCPRDGTELRRDVVGGRTTIWCPSHQR